MKTRFVSPILFATLSVASAFSVIAGCGDDGSDPATPDAAVSADANVAVDATVVKQVSIDFSGMVGAEIFSCSENNSAKSFSNIGTANSTASFKDFRLYISNIRLIDGGGNEIAVTLDQTAFQFEDVVLLDFEDGTGGCVDLGNSALNTTILGQVPAGDYNGLAFDLGVPFDKNHLEASSVTTPSPLNIMGLFWNWQIGHKYFRVDLTVDGAAGWNIHLGSTGCVSNGTAEAPEIECSKPNLSKIVVADFDVDNDTVAIDIGALLADSDVTANADGPPGCQSFPADAADCTPMYPNLGLSFETGTCVNACAAQTTFKKMP